MGNQLSNSIPSTATAGIDSYLEELEGIVYEKSMGSSSFLKTIKARTPVNTNSNDNSPPSEGFNMVVKILVKPSITTPTHTVSQNNNTQLSLEKQVEYIKAEHTRLIEAPNALPYQWCVETSRAVYLIRQYVASSLYDRISTRPFLDTATKKWIAFQLLQGLENAHSQKIYHGDIKTENVLVTSWNWAYLSDFSGFKPTFLPEDNPSDFSFFFDTSLRRACYLAPERFFDPIAEFNKIELAKITERDNQLNSKMDIFSLGCVICELFLENSPTFILSQLLGYKKGTYDPNAYLGQIECPHIRSLVKHMIQINPDDRWEASEYLAHWKGTAFPDHFYSLLHPYFSSLVDNSKTPTPFNTLNNDAYFLPSMAHQTDQRIQKLYQDFRNLEEFYSFKDSSKPDSNKSESDDSQEEGAVIISSLILSSIRNLIFPSSKVHAMDMLLTLSNCLSDPVKLDQILPYLVSLLTDKSSLVRSHCLATIATLMASVKEISSINVTLYPEYLWPHLRPLLTDSEVMVRSSFAKHLIKFAESAYSFLDMSQTLKNNQESNESFNYLDNSNPNSQIPSYSVLHEEFQSTLQDLISTLLMDSHSSVRRCLLGSVTRFCILLGRHKANDVILSHMITYLNDKDWMLRCTFFENIVGVGTYIGSRGLEEYIFPLMVQSLADIEEFVIERVILSLTSLTSLGLFYKIALWELASKVVPMICHPNVWIRNAAIKFVSVAASKMELVDQRAVLDPMILPFLKCYPIPSYEEDVILVAVAEPINRNIYEECIIWASRSPQHFLLPPSKSSPLNTLDVQEWEKLSKLGMSEQDKARLTAMREYLIKCAHARQSNRTKGGINSLSGNPSHPLQNQLSPYPVSNELPNSESGTIKLKNFDVTPQTIFLTPDPSNALQNTSQIPESSSSMLNSSQSVSPYPSSAANLIYNSQRHRRPNSEILSSRSLSLVAASNNNKNFIHPSISNIHQNEQGSSIGSPLRKNNSFNSLRSTNTSRNSSPSPHTNRGSPKMTPKLGNAIKSSDTPTVTVNPTHVEARLDNSQHSPNLTISPNSSCKIVLHSPHNNEFEMPIDDDTDLSGLNGMNRILAPLVRKKVSEAFPKPLYHFGPAVLPGFSGAGGLANSPSHNLSVEMLTARLGGKIPETPPNPQSYSINQSTAQSSSTSNPHSSGRWSPSGILVTNLVEHQSKITAIRISPDHRFFVSASEDGMVKVWDTQRLQRNVTTKSRLTYSNLSGNKITCMTFIKNTYSVAIGTDKGDIHIFRVDTTNPEPVTHDTILYHHHPSLSPKYNKCWPVCQLQLEDKANISCMEHLSNDQHSWLIFCTAQSTKIRCWDLRNNTIHFNLSNPIQYGIITALLIDPNHNWMLVGTNKGILTLWDLRFLISLRSWQHPTKSTIHKLQYHGPRTAWVSSGNENEVSLWDLHKLECVKVVTTRSTLHYGNFTGLSWKPMEVQVNPPANEMPKAPSDTNSQKSSFTPSTTLASQGQVRAMISLPPGGDYILTSGTDRIIRFWDLNRPEHSKWISPTPPSQSHLINDRVPRLGYYSMQHHGVSIIYETFGEPNQPLPASKNSIKDTQTYQNHLALGNPRLPIGVNMQNLSQPHQDCITEIQLLLYPTPMIITGDRMGFIKIFM